MRIALDAMGGDDAPREVVAGSILAVQAHPEIEVVLVGDPDLIQRSMDELVPELAPDQTNRIEKRLTIESASQVIRMHEPPVEALRRSPDSSIARAVALVGTGRAEAVVTAGNTGAAVAATHQALGRIKGIRRPGIAVVFPTTGPNPVVVIDVGATVKCQPIHLFHFGVMGDGFARTVLGAARPRVGLLNIGEEDEKGNELVRKTREFFSRSHLHFIGNIEGQEIFRGKCDVVVCEGFVGNVVLKVTEGMAEFATRYVKKLFAGDDSPASHRVQSGLSGATDFSSYGGAILLGVNGICIIGHGRSKRRALSNAITMAARYIQARVVEGIINDLRSTETKNSQTAKST